MKNGPADPLVTEPPLSLSSILSFFFGGNFSLFDEKKLSESFFFFFDLFFFTFCCFSEVSSPVFFGLFGLFVF